MDSQDKVIVCEDCKKEFAHTVEDQKRYADRGFTQDPKRCRECRQVRKEKAAAEKANPRPRPAAGGQGFGGQGFARQGSGGPGFGGQGFGQRREGQGGPRGGGGPGRFQGRSGGGHGGGFGHGGPRQSFQAICAACGVATTVPFEPKQGREVFCRDCYKRKLREG
jgi:CxxC-x17-CxxC domain-containing protein